MSCRSTPLNSLTTRVAHLTYPGLSDAQVQSLFHDLKREGGRNGVAAPSEQEYRGFLDRQGTAIRHDPALSERDRDRLLIRVDEAGDGTPDGPTWHAVQWMGSAAGTAERRLQQITDTVADGLAVSRDRLRSLVVEWRDADDGEYEDYGAPDLSYRYDWADGVPTDQGTGRALRKLGYEHYLAQRLPVFVYGTLRTGQGNDRLMDGAKEATAPAVADGIAVYRSGHGFPYAAEHEAPDARTVGEVVWLTADDAGDNARMMLDHLEGFDSDRPSTSHYERVAREVQVTGTDGRPQTITAWMYLARGYSRDRLAESARIPHGDWVAEREELFRRH